MIVNFTDISSGNPDNTADALLIPFMLQRYHEIGPLLDNLSEEDEVSIKETFNIDIQGVKNLAEELKKIHNESMDNEMISMISIALAKSSNDDRYVDMVDFKRESSLATNEVTTKFSQESYSILEMIKTKYIRIKELLETRANIVQENKE